MSLSSKFGSVESSNVRTKWGLIPFEDQIHCTDYWLTPATLAISLMFQWVAFFRLGLTSESHHRPFVLRGDGRETTRTRGVYRDRVDAPIEIPTSPEPNGILVHFLFANHRANPLEERRPIFIGQLDRHILKANHDPKRINDSEH